MPWRGIPLLVVLAGLLLCLAGPAGAHGTSEPGPHGGEIRMPGAFHIEAVAGEQALRIYVLDMQFENPVVEAASLDAKLVQGDATTPLECRPDAEVRAFVCPLPQGVRLDRGALIVDAARKGKPGEPARYPLPLDWSER